MKELVSVIIPVLNPDLNPVQEKILHHCLESLANYPIVFITYKEADLSIIREHKQDIDVVYFSKEYFESRKALGRLFLMEDFYHQFSWASYLLIHELNSWVVKDELYYWCKSGYDFLKAGPVINRQGIVQDFFRSISRITGLSKIEKQSLDSSFQDNGLYLCLVERMIATLKNKQKTAYHYRHHDDLQNSDAIFWEIEANRFWQNLRKPTSIVQNYFGQHAGNQIVNLIESKEKLPFAFTGVNSTNIDHLPYFK